MFQLWKFVLLCGLLTGTSGSVSEDLGNNPNDIVSDVRPALDKGLETIEETLDGESTRVIRGGTQKPAF